MFASIDLIEYHISVVKVSNLWSADHEFEFDLDFCLYLLIKYLFKTPYLLPKIADYPAHLSNVLLILHAIFHDQVFFCWFETPLQGVVSHLNNNKKCLLRQYTGRDIGEKMFTGFVFFFSNVAFFIYHTNHQQKHLFFKRFHFKKVRWYGAPWDFYVGESTS